MIGSTQARFRRFTARLAIAAGILAAPLACATAAPADSTGTTGFAWVVGISTAVMLAKAGIRTGRRQYVRSRLSLRRWSALPILEHAPDATRLDCRLHGNDGVG